LLACPCLSLAASLLSFILLLHPTTTAIHLIPLIIYSSCPLSSRSDQAALQHSAVMSNIHSLSSFRSDRDKKSNEEEYQQSAAGQSGTAVWRPNNSAARTGTGAGGGADPNDPVAHLLAQARAQSASGNEEGADRNIGLITLYSNGFTIGNGEFRDAKEEQNQKFLESLRKGEVPSELEPICRKEWGSTASAVRVQLVDKSRESYTPPKPKFDFSKSVGQSIASSSSSSGSAPPASFANATPRRMEVDQSQPTTTLQIVLADRKRVKETANQDATVLQLYQHIMSLTGLAGFELLSGFPPKPLTDPNQTIKEAGLLNGSITQRGGS